MYFFDADVNKKYPVEGYLKIHKNCDFLLEIEDDDIVQGFDYNGDVIDLDTGAVLITFTKVVDVGNRNVKFTLTKTQTGQLPEGTNYIYIIKRTDVQPFTEAVLGGYVAIYDA